MEITSKASIIFVLVLFSNSALANEVLVVNNETAKTTENTEARTPASYSNTYVSLSPELSDKSRNKYYDFSVDGLREYLDDLGKDDPNSKEALEPQFNAIKSRTSTAKWVGWSSFGVVTATSVILFCTIDGLGEPGVRIGVGTLIGVLLGAVIGQTASVIISPSRNDFRTFVNRNNEISPKHQLELKNLGFNIDPHSGAPSLALNFNF